VNKEPDWE